jgi:hypothetical protein
VPDAARQYSRSITHAIRYDVSLAMLGHDARGRDIVFALDRAGIRNGPRCIPA